MKAKVLLLVAVLFGTLIAKSQSIGVGKNVFYIGAGPGSGYASSSINKRGAGYTYQSTPAFQIGFERGISEAIPQSIIGIGPHFSARFTSNSYRDANGHGWDKNWSDFTFAVKGFYHHKFLVGEKWDVYGSALIGARHRSYSFSYNDSYYSNASDTYNAISPVLGIGVGGRYYVSKTFGFYAELGAGVNADYAQIGFAFKF